MTYSAPYEPSQLLATRAHLGQGEPLIEGQGEGGSRARRGTLRTGARPGERAPFPACFLLGDHHAAGPPPPWGAAVLSVTTASEDHALVTCTGKACADRKSPAREDRRPDGGCVTCRRRGCEPSQSEDTAEGRGPWPRAAGGTGTRDAGPSFRLQPKLG